MFNQFKKNNIIKYLIIFLAIMLCTELRSQDFQNEYDAQLNPNISNEWWSVHNNYGRELSQIQLNYKTSFTNEKIDFTFEIFSSKNKIYINESFIKYELSNNTYLKAGRYYKDFSNYLNDSLSSGSLLISKNAQPMPKIGLIGSYTLKRNKDFNFDLGISHGFFTKSKVYNSAPMLHEKFVYLNYSNNQQDFSLGFVHEAIWGGSTIDSGDFPHSFKDFLKVFISADGPLLEGQPHANALGNHLGIWDFKYQREVNSKIFKFYYQHFFEDTSGLRFQNKSDGLWGIELSNYIKDTTILMEYLNTMNQDKNPPYVDDNYYNHFEYLEGWSYKGYSIGNPFISHLNNNPSKIIHLGLHTYQKKDSRYKLLLSRKTDSSDSIKYLLSTSKDINQLLISFILTGEYKNSNNMSIKFSYAL